MSEAGSIELVRWPYEDEAWHLTFRATNAGYRVEQEFYVYPSGLQELAERLRAFPETRADEVIFEAGSKEPGWAHWVHLRVFLVDSAGHAAIAIDLGNNGDALRARSARFVIGCQVASVNRLGESLLQWVKEPSSEFRQALYSS